MNTVQKSNIGRPLKFKTPEEILKLGEAYLAKTPELDWTVTGLALALNTSRETLSEYQERPEFVDAIRYLKDKVEYSYELGLRRRGNAGDVFGLKNFGWRDKTESEQTIVADVTSNGQTLADPALAAGFTDYLKAQTKPDDAGAN